MSKRLLIRNDAFIVLIMYTDMLNRSVHTCLKIWPRRHRTKQFHCQQTQIKLDTIKPYFLLKMHPSCQAKKQGSLFYCQGVKVPDRNLHIWVRIVRSESLWDTWRLLLKCDLLARTLKKLVARVNQEGFENPHWKIVNCIIIESERQWQPPHIGKFRLI